MPPIKPYTAEELDRLAEQMESEALTRRVEWMAEDCRRAARQFRARAENLRLGLDTFVVLA